MKEGTCPKCGTASVHAARGGFGWGSDASATGAYIETARLVTATEVDNYICTTCGYFEHYIADPAKLAEVAQRWAPVSPSGDPADSE